MSIPVALLVAENAENKVQLDQISKKAVPDMGAICVCRDSHPPAPISCMTQAKMSVRSHSWFQVGCVAQRLLGGVGKPAPVRERGRKPRRTAASSAASHLLHDLMSILSSGERVFWDTPRVPAPCAAPMVVVAWLILSNTLVSL